jgi:hypothetical protein|tara:strand:+ start:80 stop:289 length:210 start_codon:yes stop_codon:yes gene_type:complete
MTIYSSSTGLYSIRFKKELIHEGLTHDESSDLMNYYRERYERLKDTGWPLEPEHMHVEPFSGTKILSKN